jgi:hypothetical protein
MFARRPAQILGGFLFVGVVVVLLPVLAASNTPAPPMVSSAVTAKATTTSSVYPLFNRVNHGGYGGTTLTPAQEGARYGVMVLNTQDASVIPQLKAGNPNLKVYLYLSPVTTDSNTPTGSSCVTYTEANASHANWFLQDSSSNRLALSGYPTSYVMDVGNKTYQNACATEAIADAKAGGWDGIFLDEGDPTLRFLIANPSASTLYPTDTAWQGAMLSLLKNIGPKIKKAGLSVVMNIGGTSGFPGIWEQWNTYLNGAMEESFTNGGAGPDSIENGQWLPKFQHEVWSEGHSKLSLNHSVVSSTDEVGATYGLSTTLLGARGLSTYSASSEYTTETWWPEYDTANALGKPSGAYKVLANGVYERKFANGIVLVNPHNTVSTSTSLGGTYSGSGLTKVKTATLPATSGLVMLKVS